MDLLLLESGDFLKHLEIIIISSVKFLFASPISYLYGFNYIQTVITTAIGGIVGVFIFSSFSGWFLKKSQVFREIVYNFYSIPFMSDTVNSHTKAKSKKKVFSFKNKFVAKMKINFGYIGLIAFTPVFLSIPLGAFLIKRYYSKEKNTLIYLTVSVVFWSFVLSTVFVFI
ncbi:MAG: hypothetical protein K9J13_04170 [Saprospiraceae bacterium]|nr:hypothetical protein [Saprospiraceae bacterium]